MPEVFTFSTKSPLAHRHHRSQQRQFEIRSGQNRAMTTQDILENIRILEQYQLYLQHLLLRGLLSDDEIARLGKSTQLSFCCSVINVPDWFPDLE